MTWLGLIKEKLSEEKAKGKSPSINDIMPLAKKEWAQIKQGSHPDYEQGKAQTFARKKKGVKQTKKNKSMSAGSPAAAASADIHSILREAKICTKCKKKVEKLLGKKKMKGGNGGVAANAGDFAATTGGDVKQLGGECGCNKGQSGGNCGGSCCGAL